MSMPKPFNIALAGLGTVGGGTAHILLEKATWLAERCGRALRIVAWSDLEGHGKRDDCDLSSVPWFEDAAEMAAQAPADAVVELIGGVEGMAKQVCETALAHGRHVVTANKALLAHHGLALAEAAEEKGVCLAFEAAIAGGIPIVKSLREGLVANRCRHVVGILNGTCNYILTDMAKTGRPFSDILKESQELGYAEADPSFDIDGIDTAHKLALLAALAFGHRVDFDSVHIEGIAAITPTDITHAEELGFQIKLLGIAKEYDGRVEQRVHPCLVPQSSDIARVAGVENGIQVQGDKVGPTFYQGAGAGGLATGSAVVADLADLARGLRRPAFSLPVAALKPLIPAPISQRRGAAYLRFMARDEPGVVARIAQCLSERNISMETVLQHGQKDQSGSVPVIIVTHQCQETDLYVALETTAAIPEMTEKPLMIRIESFDDSQAS